MSKFYKGNYMYIFLYIGIAWVGNGIFSSKSPNIAANYLAFVASNTCLLE